MSERKVLNKYYPPDFDPTKIPKLKRPKNRQFNIRIMAPFNMRCGTCGEYIYKGKKFNSRQEKVENEDYLGLMIFRFYIKCPRCVSEISFKTDPQNCDYSLEAGATRNFEALRTAEKLAEAEIKEKEEEEKNNPMKVLENRTKASRQEMEMLETLDELRELNSRNARLDHDSVLKLHAAYEQQLQKLQAEEDEEVIRSIFGTSTSGESIKRIHDDDGDDDVILSTGATPKMTKLSMNPSDLLTEDSNVQLNSLKTSATSVSSVSSSLSTKPVQKKSPASWQKSVGGLSSKSSLVGLVKKKMSSSASPALSSSSAAAASATDDGKAKKEPQTSSDIKLPTKNSKKEPVTSTSGVENAVSEKSKPAVVVSTTTTKAAVPDKPAPATGLGMLGAYSDSESDGSNG